MEYYECDNEMEEYWIGIKRHAVAFYNSSDKVNKWSEKLNILQSEKKYDDINYSISYYMAVLGEDMIRNMKSYYYNIYLTHVKRWEKMALSTNNHYIWKIRILCQFPKKYNNDIISLLDNEETFYKDLIDLIIRTSQASIFGMLKSFPFEETTLEKLLEDLYGQKINLNMSSDKIIRQLK
jgi:hypothetical protein